MPHPFQIFSQLDYLIQIIDRNSHTEWQTVQIQISFFLRSQLIWIYTVCKDRIYPGSAGLGLIESHQQILTYWGRRYVCSTKPIWQPYNGTPKRQRFQEEAQQPRTVLATQLTDCLNLKQKWKASQDDTTLNTVNLTHFTLNKLLTLYIRRVEFQF